PTSSTSHRSQPGDPFRQPRCPSWRNCAAFPDTLVARRERPDHDEVVVAARGDQCDRRDGELLECVLADAEGRSALRASPLLPQAVASLLNKAPGALYQPRSCFVDRAHRALQREEPTERRRD